MIQPTSQQMAAIYEMLRAFEPFNTWSLPPARKVRFVTDPKSWERRKSPTFGTHWVNSGRHNIYIKPHKTLTGMIRTMAHEMIHAHEAVNDVPSQHRNGGYVHGEAFQRIADAVCATLGFRRKSF
jgi:hypothetical protein